MARRDGSISVYLPRSTAKVDTVLAVEIIAEKLGVSFGKALERLLEESESFVQMREEVTGKISELKS